MRILGGGPDNACPNFGNRMPNVKCYEYVWNPDSPAPIGPSGWTRPNFIPTAVAWYSNEGVPVVCKVFTSLDCKDGLVGRLTGCEQRFSRAPFQDIHWYRCVSGLVSVCFS